MSHGTVYKLHVSWYIISIVIAVIDDGYTLVLGTGYATCTYYWNKGAIALTNIPPVFIVNDDVGIVLSCNIQDDLFYIISGIG